MTAFHEEDDNDFAHSDSASGKDREIHLNTTTILGIFLALTLFAAVFFGFGYTMGRRSGQSAATAADANAAGTFSGFKPAPGNPAIQPVPGYLSAKEAAAANANAPSSQVYAAPPNTTQAVTTSSPTREASAVPDRTPLPTRDTADATAIRPAPPVTSQNPTPAPAFTNNPGGPAIVQIAAVSHQEDAEVLLSALRRKGYSVVARQEPQDHLIHIQIGPFPTKREAELTRQRLLADGYNAIVK